MSGGPTARADETVISQAEYRELVDRVRDTVRATVPAGATVLVVSRGDPDLVALSGRRGWHFPQDPGGEYAGHYPKTGAEAVAHLEELRREGGEYLVVPGTALWWLEHYPELGRHLDERSRLVADVEGTCRVFGLQGWEAGHRRSAVEAGAGARILQAPSSPGVDDRFVSVLESLLPPGAGMVWVCPPGAAPPSLNDRRAWVLTSDVVTSGAGDDDADGGGLFERLERLHEAGAEFVVVPAGGVGGGSGAGPPSADGASWATVLDGRYPRVARREHLCSIYRLRPPPSESATVRSLWRRSVDG